MDHDDTREDASATGIIGCLRLLADEAQILGMNGTRTAILEALATATRECGAPPLPESWPAERPRTH